MRRGELPRGAKRSIDHQRGAATGASAIAAFGRLDILVANHGIWPPEDAPIDRMSDEQWHRTIAVNVDSVFGLVKHSVGQMKKQQMTAQGGGHIVLVSSTPASAAKPSTVTMRLRKVR